ncbi:hypothetical protein LG943_04905 [Streptomonospora sp. S1-112]|uniref:Uncharacterized protein n=1 Tax=Streptomonospora mangrovi TaxID=2883123 RepID=A0A9X3NK98_9ACTN|nr:hypothetical protein [Streptomonospora mangrovi]MDA0563673.1 hypothetical protein [Streptomonospora mangrovi]
MDDAGARGPSAAEMAAHNMRAKMAHGGGPGDPNLNGGPGEDPANGTISGLRGIEGLRKWIGQFLESFSRGVTGALLGYIGFLLQAVRRLRRRRQERRRERATPEGKARIDIKKERRAANRQRRQVRRVRNRARRRVFYARVRRFLSRLRLRAGNLRRMLGARMVRLRVFLRATRRLNAQRRENNRAARELLRGTRDREHRRQIIEARNERNREAVGARADRLNRFDARGGRELYTRRVRAEIERRNRAFDHISHPTNVRLTETLRDRARANAAYSDYRTEHRRHVRELRDLDRQVRKNDILPQEVQNTYLPQMRAERQRMRDTFEAARHGAPPPPTTAPTNAAAAAPAAPAATGAPAAAGNPAAAPAPAPAPAAPHALRNNPHGTATLPHGRTQPNVRIGRNAAARRAARTRHSGPTPGGGRGPTP